MDKDSVSKVIDSEVERVQKLNARSGITTWVLISAFAGMGWLLLSTIQENTINVRLSVLIFFIVFLLYDAIVFLRAIIFPKYTPSGRDGRFKSSLDYSTRTGTLFVLLWSLIPIWILRVFFLGVGPYLPTFVYMFYGTVFVLSTAMLCADIILNIFDLRLPKAGKTNKWSQVIFVIVDFFFFVFLFLFLKDFNYSVIDIISLKVSLLSLALLYIVTTLVKEQSSDAILLPALMDLRTNLNFGRTDPQSAFTQAEILVYGTRLDQLMQARILALMTQFDKAYSSIAKIKEIYAELGKGGLSEAEVASRIEGATRESQNLRSITHSAATLSRKLYRAMAVAISMHVDAKDGSDEINEKVSRAVDELEKQIDSIEEETKTLAATYGT